MEAQKLENERIAEEQSANGSSGRRGEMKT